MFDIGFSELFLVAVVALIVLGPERLPRAARFAGLWVRRARAQWYSVKSELERELADDELKRSLRATEEELRAAGAQLHASGQALRQEFEGAHQAAAAGTGQTPEPSDPAQETPPEPGDPGPEPAPAREPEPQPPGPREPGTPDPARRDPDPGAPERREPGDPAPGQQVDARAASTDADQRP
jgi:sec-independent protein translocase protein TatB